MALSIFIVMLGMAGTVGIMLISDFINRPARSGPRRSAPARRRGDDEIGKERIRIYY